MNFENARANCKQKGGKLFEPKDAVEMKEIAKIANNINWHWIGITDIASEGSYVYDSTGQSINFDIPWLIPSIIGPWSTSEDCLIMDMDGDDDDGFFAGKTYNVECSRTYHSICEL